jgi:hypothetical protein
MVDVLGHTTELRVVVFGNERYAHVTAFHDARKEPESGSAIPLEHHPALLWAYHNDPSRYGARSMYALQSSCTSVSEWPPLKLRHALRVEREVIETFC